MATRTPTAKPDERPANKSDTPVGTKPRSQHPASTASTADEARPLDVARAANAVTGTKSDRRRRISEGAYYRSERRGFAPGQEEKDWLEAEKEVDGTKDPGALRPEDNTFPSPK